MRSKGKFKFRNWNLWGYLRTLTYFTWPRAWSSLQQSWDRLYCHHHCCWDLWKACLLFTGLPRKGWGLGQSESRVPVLTLTHTASSQLLHIFTLVTETSYGLAASIVITHPRRCYPTHGGSLPFKVHTSSSWQVMQTFLPPFPLCNYPPATAWFRVPIHESQFGTKEGWMHEILEIVWEIPFRPDWLRLNPW